MVDEQFCIVVITPPIITSYILDLVQYEYAFHVVLILTPLCNGIL